MEKIVVNVSGVPYAMMPVEGGSYLMGATAEQHSDAWDNESPVHKVSVGDFLMGKTVVTQSLWNAVMGEKEVESSEMPVAGKDWNECQRFLHKLNELSGTKFRLPTEAEWEFAARGGKLSKGYKFPGGNRLPEVAWYDLNSGSKAHEVAQKAPNELGLYDMAGNVFEWCNDWYGLYDRKEVDHPQGPASGSQRVCRGGSFSYYDRSCRVSCRMGLEPSGKNYAKVGLRLVMDEEDATQYLERQKAKEAEAETATNKDAVSVPMVEEHVNEPVEEKRISDSPLVEEPRKSPQEAPEEDLKEEPKGDSIDTVAETEESKMPETSETLFSDSDVDGFCSWNFGSNKEPMRSKKKRKLWLAFGLILLAVVIIILVALSD